MRTNLYVPVAIIAFLLNVATALAAPDPSLPDPKLTPGWPRPESTQEVICDPNFRTAPIRAELKQSVINAVYRAYGFMKGHDTAQCASNDKEHCQLDHLISLELGGSNDPRNLWIQPYHGMWNAHVKDKLENRLHAMVCKTHELTLQQAQDMVKTNWIEAYKRVFNTTVPVTDQ